MTNNLNTGVQPEAEAQSGADWQSPQPRRSA